MPFAESFHAATLTSVYTYTPPLNALLKSLPASTRVLEIDDQYLFTDCYADTQIITDPETLSTSGSLQLVTVVDKHGWATHDSRNDYYDSDSDSYSSSDSQPSWRRPTRPRGSFDNFIASLENVVKLTVTPLAITDLASLAELKSLRALRLVVGRHAPRWPVRPSELIKLFAKSSSLKRIEIEDEVIRRWSDDEVHQVKEAAKPNISLAWL